MKSRVVEQIVAGIKTTDGAGVNLRRIIGSPELNLLDPFLLLDEFKSDDKDDYIAGFPSHPHRGFETVTYLMHGAFRHRDSKGNEGHLRSGSVQWMTAGRGIIHSEMPEQEDGQVWGYQLWVNLPQKYKMTEPRYQDIPAEKIPVVEENGRMVKIIAGEYDGVEGPAESFFPISYFDVTLEANSSFRHATKARSQWDRKRPKFLSAGWRLWEMAIQLNCQREKPGERFFFWRGSVWKNLSPGAGRSS